LGLGDPDRRLAAVLALDVVGYSAMMHRDELATLNSMQRLQTVIAALIEGGRGRVFKQTGDGVLAEFGSVLEAFNSARAILAGLDERVSELSVRIGLHLGDLLFVGSDVFGDGVNVAARIESLAPPNTIAVSERAWLDLRRTDAAFEDLGLQNLKNIALPVRIFVHDPGHRGTGHRTSARRASREAALPLVHRELSNKLLLATIIAAAAVASVSRSKMGEGLSAALTETGLPFSAVLSEVGVAFLAPLFIVRFVSSPVLNAPALTLLASSLVMLCCYMILLGNGVRSLGRRWQK